MSGDCTPSAIQCGVAGNVLMEPNQTSVSSTFILLIKRICQSHHCTEETQNNGP
ncbi:hypothetical protein DsansV1_C01g0012911 [Dioscorea sansibarensis]